jgi:hypothetical protein
MLNRQDEQQELQRVNMFIRALSDEMAHTPARSDNPLANAIAVEMEEALYELRLRKLLICAFVDSDNDADTTNH